MTLSISLRFLEIGPIYAKLQLGEAAYVLGRHHSEIAGTIEGRYLMPECRQPLARSYCFRPGETNTVGQAVDELASVMRTILYYQQTLFERAIPACCATVTCALQKALGGAMRLAPKPPYATALYGSSLANVYDELRPLDQAALAGLRSLAKCWLRDHDILELGAGTGRIGMTVLPFVRSYHGIEFSAAMLERFQQKLSTISATHANIELGDALALNFPDQSFDSVIEHEVMLFVPDPLKSLGEAFRVLKPGGQFIRVLIHTTERGVLEELLRAFRQEICASTGYPFVIRGKGTDALITATLQKRNIATTEVILTEWEEHSTLGALIATLERRAYPYLEDIPAELLHIGIEALRRHADTLRIETLEDIITTKRRLYCLISAKPML